MEKIIIFLIFTLSGTLNYTYSQNSIPDSLIDNSKPGLDLSSGICLNQNQSLFNSITNNQNLKFKNKFAYDIRLFFLKKGKFKYGLEINLNSLSTSFDSVEFKGNNINFLIHFEFKGNLKPTVLNFGVGTSIGVSMESNTLYYNDASTNTSNQLLFNRSSTANQYLYNTTFEPNTLFFGILYWNINSKSKSELFLKGNYFLNLSHLNNQFNETRAFKNGFSVLIGFSFQFKK